MDETLNDERLSNSQEKEIWHKLTAGVLSICDDYNPDVIRGMECCKTTNQIRSPCQQKGILNNHDAETRDEHVGGSHVVCLKKPEGPSQDEECGMSTDKHSKTTIWENAWQSQGQAYQINGWENTSNAETRPLIGCTISMRNCKPRRVRTEESDDEEETQDFVCNMTGQTWESLPFPITIDSGSCASVMPTSWCGHVPLQETEQSRAGEYYRAANGQKIYHEGERVISMMTQEGALRDKRFTACDVSKALGSVSQMCRTGHRVIFNPPWSSQGSYIEHVASGEGRWLQEEGGLYVLKTKVVPTHKHIGRQNAADPPWQVRSP